MTREVHATIPGNPGLARVNARLAKAVVGRRVHVYPSSGSKAWRRVAIPLLRRAMAGRAAFEGPVEVVVREYWPRRRHLDGCPGLAMGDVDAPLKEILDALEAAGVVGDDAQVRRVVAEKFVEAGNPRVEVEVRRWLAPPE